MFETEQQIIEEKIKAYCAANDIPLAALKWTAIPFSGEWGIATRSSKPRRMKPAAGKGKKLPVPQRAQEIAEQVKAEIGSVDGISHVEAVKGYLNLYFTTSEYARRVVDEVLTSHADFGRGQAKNERVMVEYAQPNTHHSFHIGHARNTIFGEVLARMVEFAGFDTIRASYPGDMGLGVITVLWAYDKFYKGQEPEGIHERGQWLLKIYVEATALLEKKENETPEETAQREAYDAERRDMYRKWDADDAYVHELWHVTREWSSGGISRHSAYAGCQDGCLVLSRVKRTNPRKEIVEELIAKGIAEDERPQGGPVIVKIDEKLGLPRKNIARWSSCAVMAPRFTRTKIWRWPNRNLKISRRSLDLCCGLSPEPAFSAGIQDSGTVGISSSSQVLSPLLWICHFARGSHVCAAWTCGVIQGSL